MFTSSIDSQIADAVSAALPAEALPAVPAALPAALPADPDANVEPKSDREAALAVLDRDHEFENIGATGDLFKYGELGPVNTAFDGSMPVVHNRYERFGDIYPRETSRVLSEFERKLPGKTIMRLFSSDLMKKSGPKGLVVAGGSLAASITGTSFGDIDMFLVGLTEDEATETILCLGTMIRMAIADNAAEKSKPAPQLHVYRTERCITFFWNYGRWSKSFEIQVILRRYNTVSEILHGFDLGSSAVAFDGEEIWLTSIGKYAFERMVNIADPHRRRASYESRLGKYMSRGFGVAFPHLNVDAFKDVPETTSWSEPNYDIDMPKLSMTNLSKHKHVPTAYGADVLLANYGDGKHATSSYGGTIAYGHHAKIAEGNAFNARKEVVNTAGLCAHAIFADNMDLAAIQVTFEGLGDHIRSASMGNKVDMKTLVRCMGGEAASHLVRSLARVYDTNFDNIDFDAIASAIAAPLRERAHIPFIYMAPTNGMATEGPLAGELMTDREWYGEHYAE